MSCVPPGFSLRDVDVHSPVVRPVVGEGNDKADAVRLRVRDDGVEARDTEAASVEGRNAVLPELGSMHRILEA